MVDQAIHEWEYPYAPYPSPIGGFNELQHEWMIGGWGDGELGNWQLATGNRQLGHCLVAMALQNV